MGCFNPRTHTGCDTLWTAPAVASRAFQSTHPHGVRLYKNSVARGRVSFNPRTHTGCDLKCRPYLVADLAVSIHAPTRGATADSDFADLDLEVSIHAPTRGATAGCAAPCLASLVSIHAPTRGATLTLLRIVAKTVFQSTHPHGVRPRSML